MNNEKRFALLIDADNVSPKYLTVILNEAKAYGLVNIRRIYGDWTDSGKKAWKSSLLEHSIMPIQQYSYTTGKNASDSAMIIDAMDILYSNNIDGFIIASSDSDFTRLAMRLRESGKNVIGMGESKTPAAFVKSCEEFKILDVIFKNTLSEEEQKELSQNTQTENISDEEVISVTDLGEIKKSIADFIEKHSDEEGKMLLADLGRLLTRKHPDFDERNYGRYRKFSEFIRQMDEFEVDMVYFKNQNKPPLAYIKKKKA